LHQENADLSADDAATSCHRRQGVSCPVGRQGRWRTN